MSYDTVREIETCWAENILSSGDGYATIPSNIKVGDFVQVATDNGDYSQENSTQHVTNTVLYQYPLTCGSFIRDEVLKKTPKRKKRRTLTSFQSIPLLQLPSTQRCNPPSYYGEISMQHFSSNENDKMREICKAVNMAWILCRNLPTKLFQINVSEPQKIPAWSGFHALLSVNVSSPTTIGNCRSIPAPPTDIQVVYTMLVNVERMLSKLGQTEHAVTMDEGVYCIASEVKWIVVPLFDHMFLRMGGFHRLKNFMGVIGRRMEDSGFEDIFLEAGIYGATQMSGIVKAKCYNRTLSAHKVLLEALMRIYWNNFADWIEEDINVTNEEKKHIKSFTESVHNLKLMMIDNGADTLQNQLQVCFPFNFSKK